MLATNSSHLTKPLDLTYFRPLNIMWREILAKWKESASDKAIATLFKDTFGD